MAARAHAQVDVRRRQAQFLEKDAGHIVVVVLTGVEQALLDRGVASHFGHQRGHFHQVGASAHDVQYSDDCPSNSRE